MEKRSAHCDLSTVRALVNSGGVRSTYSALTGAASLGMDFAEMLEVVRELVPADFYKSMTTHADHRVWQDVYRPATKYGEIYLKLTVVADVLIVSFKPL